MTTTTPYHPQAELAKLIILEIKKLAPTAGKEVQLAILLESESFKSAPAEAQVILDNLIYEKVIHLNTTRMVITPTLPFFRMYNSIVAIQ
jgi:hypothetical protein